MSSDWSSVIRPVAAKLHAELSKTHGKETSALVEALEIARRRAEIEATEQEWRVRHGFDLDSAGGNFGSKLYQHGGNLLATAGTLFKTLSAEFGAQRAVHILTGIEREHTRARWGTDLLAWRQRGGMSVESAARELGLAVEDIEAIERGDFSAGPEVMRLVRPALRRVRGEHIG
jgi:hypothetical protein